MEEAPFACSDARAAAGSILSESLKATTSVTREHFTDLGVEYR